MDVINMDVLEFLTRLFYSWYELFGYCTHITNSLHKYYLHI